MKTENLEVLAHFTLADHSFDLNQSSLWALPLRLKSLGRQRRRRDMRIVHVGTATVEAVVHISMTGGVRGRDRHTEGIAANERYESNIRL